MLCTWLTWGVFVYQQPISTASKSATIHSLEISWLSNTSAVSRLPYVNKHVCSPVSSLASHRISPHGN